MNTTLDDLRLHKVYLEPFLNSLWHLPNIMYKILIKSDPEDVKNNLAPFVVNNFYFNLLSGNYIENNLLYIIALSLKDEIDKLENINQVDKFLDNTICGYLLEQLQKMPDIQIYFKNVILKTVETIERTCSSKVINFNLEEKEKEFAKIGILGSRNDTISIEVSCDLMISEQKENIQINESQYDSFMKYYALDLKAKDLENLAQNSKNEDKTELTKYYNNFAEEIKSKDEKLYYNSILIKEIYNKKYSDQIFNSYQIDFMQIISFVDQLIEDLMNNILLLPNTIKFICKIISILIKNKFPNISKIEENAFISKFIFNRLLNPIISFPSFNALISDFVISGNTLENIKTINIVLSKLFSGKLFENNSSNCCYTPFNRFILGKMETILSFFEKAINVNLPKFIEQLASNELPKDYQYEFFKENEEQIYANISICFNLNNIESLIKGLDKNKEIFESIDKKDINMQKIKFCYERFISKGVFDDFRKIDEALLNKNKEDLKNKEQIRKNDTKKKNKKIEIENFYIYNSNAIEEKYAELFSLNNKNGIFYIKTKKGDKTDGLGEKEKNIIKVKNYLCSSLGDFRLLNKSDFNLDSTTDTRKLLNEIKKYMALPNFILSNNTIPSTWYINSILDYLNKIPDDYKENDYKKLFDELSQNLNDSINKLNFEILILFRNKLKFIGKIYNYYENVKDLMDTININEKIKQIAEENFIPMDLTFKYEENSKIFELKKSGVNKKQFEDNIAIVHGHKKDKNKYSFTSKTVEAFTRYFPNLAEYQVLQETSPIKIIDELSINEKLNNYFGIIKKEMLKIPEIKEHEELYKGKIEDYIMNKIYDKIYPPEPDDIDGEIYKKTIQLSWVDPYSIVKKDYIYDNMLPDILNEFGKINNLKSPYQKLKCIETINGYIVNLIKFNEGLDKEIGAEDVTPILNYVFIKSHPFKIYTDVQFIKLFLPQNGQNDFSISSMESMYTLIRESDAKQFNMTPGEFKRKCNDAINSHYTNTNN